MASDQAKEVKHEQAVPRWIRIFTLLMVSLSILGPILPSIQISMGSLFPFRLLLPVYVVSLIRVLSTDHPQIGFSRVSIPLLGFVCLAALSTIYTSPTGVVLNSTILFLAKLIILSGIIITINTRYWIYQVWTVLTILSLLAFAIVSIEFLTGWHAPFSQLQGLPNRPPYSGFVTGWYTNVNDLSFFLSFATIPALVTALNSNRNYQIRVFSASIWTIGAYLVVHLQARAVMLAYLITAIVAATFMYSKCIRTIAGQIPTRAGQTVLPLAGLLMTSVFIVAPNPISTVESSLWIRWQLQKAAVIAGGIYGHGFGSSITAISQVPIPTSGFTSPHSWFGAVLTNTGILGLIIFLLFYGRIIVRSFQASESRDPIQIMGTGALVALPVAGLGPSNALFLPTFWVVLGLSISTTLIYDRSHG